MLTRETRQNATVRRVAEWVLLPLMFLVGIAVSLGAIYLLAQVFGWLGLI